MWSVKIHCKQNNNEYVAYYIVDSKLADVDYEASNKVIAKYYYSENTKDIEITKIEVFRIDDIIKIEKDFNLKLMYEKELKKMNDWLEEKNNYKSISGR